MNNDPGKNRVVKELRVVPRTEILPQVRCHLFFQLFDTHDSDVK